MISDKAVRVAEAAHELAILHGAQPLAAMRAALEAAEATIEAGAWNTACETVAQAIDDLRAETLPVGPRTEGGRYALGRAASIARGTQKRFADDLPTPPKDTPHG